MDQFTFIASLVAVFLVAGTVKGTVGLGLPTTALGLMTLFIDPRSAIAILIFPIVLSNAWQMYRAGNILVTIRQYLPMSGGLVIFVWISVNLTVGVQDWVLLAALGFSILFFVAVNATNLAPTIPARFDSAAQSVAGIVAGIMGGLTSVWAPPLAIYLAAREVPKEEFVRATGLIFFLGSIPLALGYIRAGFMTGELATISGLVLIPTFVGFWIGERLRDRMSEQAFKKLVLVIFLIMGLNLLRRAFFG
jgi:uncharacterized membrane protein YfcA